MSSPLSLAPERKIPVMEIFGPTVQGEGMVIGQKTMFVRTSGCDYRCSWCDSAFTWDGTGKEMIQLMSPEDIWAKLHLIGGTRFSHVTLSGGNPALLPQMASLIQLLESQHIRIAVETQGSRWQDWLMQIHEVTVSPKPPSSGMITNWTVLDDLISRLSTRGTAYSYSLKIVIFNEADLDFAKQVHLRYPSSPFYLQVGNADTKTDDIPGHASSLLHEYEALIEAVMKSDVLNDVRVLPQLHTLVWGNKRGV
ncbi:7-carboxy-7-deazaguanine synthase [Paenibacillus shirakamiensis]|uniref:7-carboxy-7-deazaguanine synthase n=1 Tax=Paenibacillus shirakamiensis TaxID=1265935 RepID=A0ABS4JHI8_9BACL|nr:7-carboxy-7-deazaguanine synthase QueE [Paenibacillus shirakamiensis]MBP2000515.1 7-carboxy-7-deazaguanine synthase [Paenibacillus shirakamiensis]